MIAIHKYPLRLTEQNATGAYLCTIQMPADADILSVQRQGDTYCVWAGVDPSHKDEPRTFRLLGTGWEVSDEEAARMTHLETLQDGSFVWHIFEVKT